MSRSETCSTSPPLGEDNLGAAQETPEGHAVRLDGDGDVRHITAVNAPRVLDGDGVMVATLRDGRALRLARAGVADLLG